MKMFLARSLVILAIYIVHNPFYAIGAEGVSMVNAESETVSAAPARAVSARSACPAGKDLIGGGGECYGFLVTEGRVSLAKSAPAPDGSSWYVECVNTGSRPGEVRVRAWAICADPVVFEVNDKKK